MRKWRILALCIIACLCISGLTACGSNDGRNSNVNGATDRTSQTEDMQQGTTGTNKDGVAGDVVDDVGEAGKDVIDGVGEAGKDVIDGAEDAGKDLIDGAEDLGDGLTAGDGAANGTTGAADGAAGDMGTDGAGVPETELP